MSYQIQINSQHNLSMRSRWRRWSPTSLRIPPIPPPPSRPLPKTREKDLLPPHVREQDRRRTTHKNFFLDFILFFSFVLCVLFLNNIICRWTMFLSVPCVLVLTYIFSWIEFSFFFSFLLIPGPKTSRWNYFFFLLFIPWLLFPLQKKLFFM